MLLYAAFNASSVDHKDDESQAIMLCNFTIRLLYYDVY